jgi:hypothetical protein
MRQCGKYGRVGQATGDIITLCRKLRCCIPVNCNKNTDTLVMFNRYYFSTTTLVAKRILMLPCTCIPVLLVLLLLSAEFEVLQGGTHFDKLDK